jgi:hypothetical protein
VCCTVVCCTVVRTILQCSVLYYIQVQRYTVLRVVMFRVPLRLCPCVRQFPVLPVYLCVILSGYVSVWCCASICRSFCTFLLDSTTVLCSPYLLLPLTFPVTPLSPPFPTRNSSLIFFLTHTCTLNVQR